MRSSILPHLIAGNIEMQNSSELSLGIMEAADSRATSLPVRRHSLAYITVVWPFRSGSEVFFTPELKELRSANIELRVLPRDVPKPHRMTGITEDLSRCVYGVPPFSLRVLWASLLESIRNPPALLRALVILFSSIDLNLILNLAIIPKALWLAHFARRSGITHLHAQWGGTTATMAMIASHLTGIPWSVTYHRNDLDRGNLLKIKLQRASFVRFISEAGLEMAEAKTGISQNKRFHVLHLGIEVPPAPIKTDLRRSVPVLCCAASLIPLKGHGVLFDALASVKSRGQNFRLRIAGDGELRDALERRSRELDLSDKVEFVGHMDRDQLLATYARNEIDIFVLASYIEGIPVSAMEACSYGIPCIVSDVGGVKELLRDGAGILIPPGDHVALADAIESLLINGDLRERLGNEGRRRIEQFFDARTTTAAFLQLVYQ